MIRACYCRIVVGSLITLCLAPKPATAITFTEKLLSSSYTYAYGLAAGDVTLDGKTDIVSANATSGDLYYYQNKGNETFTRKTIEGNDGGILERMAVGDVDNDGRPDVAIVQNQVGFPNPPDPNHGELYWYKNPTNGGWQKKVISNYYNHAYDVAFGDFDKDGKIDVAASSYVGGAISWFKNTGNNNTWAENNLASGIGETRTARVADFNGDTDLDILATSRTGNKTIWYENNGNSTFTSHNVDTTVTAPTHGQPWDIDGDGDKDIAMAAGYGAAAQNGQVLWYENNGSGSFTKRTVGALPFAFEAAAGDLDNDGDVDIAATAFTVSTNGDHVVWFENIGSGSWTKHVLKTNWYGANSIILTDVNADGQLDIFASAESTTNEVRWWRNNGGALLASVPEPSLLPLAATTLSCLLMWRRNRPSTV